jgi:hypothetical protein
MVKQSTLVTAASNATLGIDQCWREWTAYWDTSYSNFILDAPTGHGTEYGVPVCAQSEYATTTIYSTFTQTDITTGRNATSGTDTFIFSSILDDNGFDLTTSLQTTTLVYVGPSYAGTTFTT